jgi:protein-tyrosine-phosphatase
MPSILFVCTANRFRSPLAAAWFKRRLDQDADARSWPVASAGTWTEPGLTVFPSARWAKNHFGLDLSAHKSQCVSRDLLARYDLILVMENSHREALLVEFPETRGRLFLLSEVAVGQEYDVLDPGIQSRDNFQEIAIELHDLIDKGYASICRLARQLHSSKAT